MPERFLSCPGCAGRGIVVALNSVLPCGRCHGAGRIDALRERIELARADEEFQERLRKSIEQNADLLRVLASR